MCEGILYALPPVGVISAMALKQSLEAMVYGSPSYIDVLVSWNEKLMTGVRTMRYGRPTGPGRPTAPGNSISQSAGVPFPVANP